MSGNNFKKYNDDKKLQKAIDAPKPEVPAGPEFQADQIWLNDILTTYGKTPDEFSELVEFPDLYLRNISKGLRPVNDELRKAIKEYIKHHPRGGQ